MSFANVMPSRRERCCTAVVKNDEESTSSHRSNLGHVSVWHTYKVGRKRTDVL